MRLLMLGCSERKVEERGRLPAFQRYDGPAYRVFSESVYPVSEVRLDLRRYTDP